MKNLQMFVAGKGITKGRAVIRERLNDIYEDHKKIHQLSEKYGDQPQRRKIRRILRDMYKGESMMGGITHGELSRENFIISMLKWPME